MMLDDEREWIENISRTVLANREPFRKWSGLIRGWEGKGREKGKRARRREKERADLSFSLNHPRSANVEMSGERLCAGSRPRAAFYEFSHSM